jgi:hypothetical protein
MTTRWKLRWWLALFLIKVRAFFLGIILLHT